MPLRRLTASAVGLLLCVSTASQAQNAPPPGMVTGAWGFSQLQAIGSTKVVPPAAPASAALVTPTAAPSANPAADSVSRFLQERGFLSPGQAEPGRLMEQVRDAASNLVISSMNFLGVRYTRGGSSEESGFDCSGFTRHIFESSVGMILPRRADEQAKMSNLLTVKRDELKPGDLVFFNTMKRTFSHVGIYVGEGKFIHSPRVGGAVRVEDMREAYWAKRFTGARRADLKAAESPAQPRPGR
ncbi:C40 family peptidase [Roseateles sp.]|uniref:C40 family peptidase n=1 Tax=Roseateles sp. TaxID=1971397 RepID=UPI00286B9400|nr:C40 family peptidase [Roseateles sp.]